MEFGKCGTGSEAVNASSQIKALSIFVRQVQSGLQTLACKKNCVPKFDHILGFYGDNGKENGNYYIGVYNVGIIGYIYTKSKGCRAEPHPEGVKLLRAVVPGTASTMEVFGCDQGSWLAASPSRGPYLPQVSSWGGLCLRVDATIGLFSKQVIAQDATP